MGCSRTFTFGKETDQYFFDASALNIGYRDQRYKLDYERHRLNFAFLWDSIPLNYSYLTVSPWTVSDNGVLTLDPARPAAGAEPDRRRRAVRAGRAAGGVRQPDAGGAGAGQPVDLQHELADAFDIRHAARHGGRRTDVRAPREPRTSTSAFTTTQQDGPSALGRLVRVQQRQRAPAAHRQPDQRLLGRRRWANRKGMFRLGLGRVVLQQRCPDV